MVKKILFISLALFGLLFSTMPPACFADAATQLEQAETYKNNGQYEQAEAIYKTVVTDYAGSDYALEAQRNLAILYIDWGNGPQAQAACERLITDFSSHPALPGALYQVANKYQILQRHEQAIELYQYIVDNRPESDKAVLAQMDVVISNLELGNDAEAEAATDKLIADFAAHPDLPEALCGVAYTYQNRQRQEQALELYQYIVDNLPESDKAVPAQMDVVISNLELGKDSEAQAATDKLIADFNDHPDLPEALNEVANEYQGWQRHEQAIKLYQYIADNRPESDRTLPARMGVVISNIALGDDPNARAVLDSLIADFNDHPGLPEALYQVANQYQGRQKHEQARQLYQYIVDNLPESEYVILSRGGVIMADIGLGNDANAQAAIDNLIADFNDHPALPEALYQVANQYQGRQKHEQARQLYQYIVDNLPESEYVILSRGGVIVADIGLGNDPNAQAAIDSLIADFNDHPALPEVVFVIGEQHYNKACIYKNEGLDTKANENFTKAISVWGKIITELPASAAYTPRFYYVTAVVYSQELGEYAKGIEHYQHIVDNWPDYEFAWHAQYFVGMYYERLLKSGGIEESEALPKIEQAYIAVVEKYPNSKSTPYAALKLGRLNFEKSQWVDAAMYFELFLQKDNGRAPHFLLTSALYDLGRAYEEMGELDKAAEIYRIFIEIADPTDPRVKSATARLEELKE